VEPRIDLALLWLERLTSWLSMEFRVAVAGSGPPAAAPSPPPLRRRGEDRVLNEVRTPARGANRIEILAMITRGFSEMITRVSLDLSIAGCR
jgi:hypothetical protein